MPLCKLEVPTGSQLGPLSRDVKGGVLSTCDRVLDLTLTELKIPADDTEK